MKLAIVCAVLLSAATAIAETTIIEYPDHFYVESVGATGGKPALSRDNSTLPAKATPVADHESTPPPATARPVTSFNSTQQSMDPAERRASMERELQRLQRERTVLLTSQEGETFDQANHRQEEALSKLRKINKMSSELVNTPTTGQ
jgi:hypothetical protein